MDSVSKDALARSICARLCSERRSVDELRVIDWVLQGLELGADDYGPLTIATDPRNFIRERAMEARDLLFYSAAQAIADHDARVEQVKREFEEAMAVPGLPPPDAMSDRIDEMARKLDEDRARNEQLKREVERQRRDDDEPVYRRPTSKSRSIDSAGSSSRGES